MLRVDGDGQQLARNEVKEYQDLRSIGASEAAWRLFQFEMGDRYPSVKRLPVHLENQQPVYIFEDISLPEALERAEVSELTAFFRYNYLHPETNTPYFSGEIYL